MFGDTKCSSFTMSHKLGVSSVRKTSSLLLTILIELIDRPSNRHRVVAYRCAALA